MGHIINELEIYKTICEPKFSDLKDDIGEVAKTIADIRAKVYNGLATDVAYVKEYIDAVREKKRKRLTARELLVRSVAVAVGAPIATALILAALKLISNIPW